MKNLHLTVCTLFIFATASLTNCLQASDQPEAFCGIPMGATVDAAKKIFSPRPGIQFIEETPSSLIYVGGSLLGIPVERWQFDFKDGFLYQSSACLSIPQGTALDGTPLRNYQFENLVASFNAKYGDGKRSASQNRTQQEWTFPEEKNASRCKILLNYQWEPNFQFIVQYTWSTPEGRSDSKVQNPDL